MFLLPVLGTRGRIHGVWYQFSYRLAQKSKKKTTQTMVHNTLVLSRGVTRDYAPQLVPKNHIRVTHSPKTGTKNPYTCQ